MLRPLWLASASLLILPVLGFYPYQRGELAQKPADIQPASAAGGGHECLNVRSLALNLKKQRVRVCFIWCISWAYLLSQPCALAKRGFVNSVRTNTTW